MWFSLGLIGVYAALCYRLGRATPARLRKRGDDFARRNLAFIDSEFVPYFDRVSRWFLRMYGVSFFLFWAVQAGLPYVHPDLDPVLCALVLVFGGSLVTWAAVRVRVAGREFPVPAGRGPQARVHRVDLADYVSPWVKVFPWVAAGFALVNIALVLAADPTKVDTATVVLSLVTGVVLVVSVPLLHLGGRALCDRPQAAVDPCHLYFQDAWRAEFLQGAFLGVGAVALLYVGVVSTNLPTPLVWINLPVVVLLFAAGSTAGFQAQLHFRRRLWPTLAPGQVLLPGQAVPAREVSA